MAKNNSLNNARNIKNDEFYTLYEDIERELKHYKDHFKNKIIYCDCDNPKYSNFWKYFFINFKDFGLKKLISTYYSKKYSVCKTEYDGVNTKIETLSHNGDFRNKECIDLLKKSDIVITNPPFSIWSDFVNIVIDNDKDFIIVGNKNAIISKKLFILFMKNKIKYGFNNISNFMTKNGDIQKFGNVCWFTNLHISKKMNGLDLNKRYDEEFYQKYDNFDAINIDRLKDIPYDYDGIMGVPITFLEKYNSEQFEILGLNGIGLDEEMSVKPINEEWLIDYFKQGNKGHYTTKMRNLVLYENGMAKVKYKRVLIKRRK